MKIRDERGIAHNIMLAGIAVMVLGAIGFAGFRVYSVKKLSAQAATWKTVASIGGLEIKACKNAYGSGKVYFLNRTDYNARIPEYGNYTVKAHSNSISLGSSNGIVWSMTNGRATVSYKMNVNDGLGQC